MEGVEDIDLDVEYVTPGTRSFDIPCPECGGALEPRMGKHGLFYGCTQYPRCVGAKSAGEVPPEPRTVWERLLED